MSTDLPPDPYLLEFAYTSWADSCQDIYDLAYQCRRPYGHDGDHAAGYGSGRRTWDDDPVEGWFWEYGDKLPILARVMGWWRRH